MTAILGVILTLWAVAQFVQIARMVRAEIILTKQETEGFGG